MDCLKRIILICVYDIDNNCTEVYNYDNRGNILTVSKSGTLFLQYVYDEASQVKAEYNYAEKTAMTYVYDANGNIVSKTRTRMSQAPTFQLQLRVRLSYTVTATQIGRTS